MENIKIAVDLMEKGQVEEALQQLNNLFIETDDENKFLIIELYEEWGYVEEAIEKLNVLLQSYPDEGQLITKLAGLYIEINEDERALELLDTLQSSDPFYLHALLLKADLYERQGLYEVAEEKLFEAKELVTDDEAFIIDFALAELLFSTGQTARSITFYEKILPFGEELNQVSITERLAEGNALLGKYEEALIFYERITKESPDILFKHAFTAFQAKQTKKAISLWEKLLELEPDYTSVYAELATAYEQEQLWEKAFHVAKLGLTFDEFNKSLYFIAGKMAFHLNNIEESKQLLFEAIHLDDDYQEAILTLIEVLKINDEHKQIVSLLTNIKSSGGADPIIDWELAKAYIEVEAFGLARKSYEEASYHFKNDRTFLREYGYYLLEEGAINQAREVLQSYLQFEPHDEETRSILERFSFSNDEDL